VGLALGLDPQQFCIDSQQEKDMPAMKVRNGRKW